jgi:luciferase family oxidoreductase group 1
MVDTARAARSDLPLSLLDLAPVGAGGTATEALARTVELARLADRLGYRRYWLAEHHGLPTIASSAPDILIGNVASATERIRVGSGGIMLPNHVPLQVAERFHTLEALHPGRIDLGIGRAPGTDPATVQALRPFPAERFAELLAELVTLSNDGYPEGHPFHAVRVVPAGVDLPPIWLLGSSGASASLAGSLGMGYSFASHFSPSPPAPALSAYRDAFRPSDRFPAPHAILAVAVVCAETEAEARRLASSMELAWVRLRRGELRPLPPPEEALAYPYTPAETAVVEGYRRLALVGTPDAVAARLRSAAAEAQADEVMVTTTVHGHEERLRSFELLAGAMAR